MSMMQRVAGAFALLVVFSVGARGRETVMSIDRVRAAVITADALKDTSDVLLTGTATQNGQTGDYRLRVSADGRFARRIGGDLEDAVGFDGTAGWAVDWTGMPMLMELYDQEVAEVEAWVMSGAWLATPGLVEVVSADTAGADGEAAFAVRTRSGRSPMRLIVDSVTGLPKRIERRGPGGEERWEFEEYFEAAGRRVARRFVKRMSGQIVSSVTVDDMTGISRDDSSYGSPCRRHNDTSFGDSTSTVAVRRAPTGHVLVHPLVDGRDVGWFILDTGAGHLILSAGAARVLDLPKLGETMVTSIFGTIPGAIYRGVELTLGPVTLARPVFTEMDLAPLEPYFGETLGGVIGYDVLSRCVVEIDLSAETVRFFDPAVFEDRGVEWRRLHLNQHIPIVEAGFEGKTGLFRLDVGASGGPHGNVVFHAPAVRELHLLDGRDAAPVKLAQQDAAIGKIGSFELAGVRFENPDVVFATGADGPFSDEYTAGNIGVGFLKSFRILFDYQRARVAFIRKDGGKP